MRPSHCLVAAILALTVACSKLPPTATQAATVPTVAVAKALPRDIERHLTVTAEFRPFQEVDVMAKVSGYVRKINVDVGDRVTQGQLLATLEIPEMNNDVQRAQATLNFTQSGVQRALDEVQRAESAHEMLHLAAQRLSKVNDAKPGLVAQQEIDDAQSKDLVGEAQLAAAKSALAAARQQVGVSVAEQDRTKTMFDYARVTAPFTGVVTKRYADNGSMIQAGTASQTQAMPLVRVSQNSLLRLVLPVPESAVSGVHLGQHVEVRVPTLNRTFPGTVARFTDRLQTATRTMDTEVDVLNNNLVLIPGMYAEVDLTLERHPNALAVPLSAVDSSGATGTVIVANASGKIELRKVQVGIEAANYVEIRAGIEPGELVVIGSRASLQAGQQVRAQLTELTAEKGQ